MRILPLALLASTGLLFLGCLHDDDDDDDDDAGADTPTPAVTEPMTMSYSGLEPLGPDAVYEGWLIVDGAAVSSGRFTVDAAGDPVPASFEIPAEQADAATAFVLTIEPATGDDPAPSATHILAGDFLNGMASLDTDHPSALGTDFSSSAGTFFLATPTTTSTTDEDQGIWFIDTSGGGPSAGLTLPTLPSGWTYEGWVVLDGTPVSTGTFDDPAMADSDGAGATAGPEGAPPFPGQDFISPARSLPGGTAVISVEPVPDNSAAPFAIKPLVGSITDAGAGVAQSMAANLASVPSGMVSFGDAAPMGKN